MRKFVIPLLLIAIGASVYYYSVWQHWLSYSTGSYNVPGVAHNYNAFSGSLADIGQYTIATGLFGNIAMAWRTHTCHRYWWCWRSGHHSLSGTPYKLCAKHHPDDVPPVARAVAEYVEASGD